MSKPLLNAIFVVEGKHDAEKLAKLSIPYIVITDGTYVPRETILHLQKLEKLHKIAIIVDPDGPGNQIYDKLSVNLYNLERINVVKSQTIKKQTVGIENMALADIQNYLHPYMLETFETQSDVTFDALVSLNLLGPGSLRKRQLLAEHFKLLPRSLKNIFIQIQLLNISLDQIKKALHE